MYKFLVSALFLVSVISCSPNINSDDKSPIIENLKIVNIDSINKVQFYVGVEAQFSANFIDNQELGSYKFDIHFAGDGHKHTHVDVIKKSTKEVEWNFTKNGEINGTEQKVTFTKKVDLEANAGPYHCVVYTVDKAGNSAVFVQKKFLVANADMPIYTITEPDFTDYKISQGATMVVKGTAYGKRGISKLGYIIRSIDDEDSDDLMNNSEDVTGSVKDVIIDLNIDIPADAPLGNYVLLLLASDKVGNVGEYARRFEIIK